MRELRLNEVKDMLRLIATEGQNEERRSGVGGS